MVERNKQSWFTPERRTDLERVCAGWIGTPFSPNGEAKGAGVSCQKLVAAIYAEVGFGAWHPPEVQMGHHLQYRNSLVDEFMSTLTASFDLVEPGKEEISAGDLLGFRIGKTVHHLGIALANDRFIHVARGIGVTINQLSDPVWGRRLARVWRPKDERRDSTR